MHIKKLCSSLAFHEGKQLSISFKERDLVNYSTLDSDGKFHCEVSHHERYSEMDEALVLHHLEKGLLLPLEYLMLLSLHNLGCEIDMYIMFLFLIVGGSFFSFP